MSIKVFVLFYFLKEKEERAFQLWDSKKRLPLPRASGLPGSETGAEDLPDRKVLRVWPDQEVKRRGYKGFCHFKSGTLSSHNMAQRHL